MPAGGRDPSRSWGQGQREEAAPTHELAVCRTCRRGPADFLSLLTVFFSLFVVLIKNPGGPLPSCEWVGPAQGLPPALLSDPEPRGCPAGPGEGPWAAASQLCSGSHPGWTGRRCGSCPCSNVCVQRKDQEQEPNTTQPCPAAPLPRALFQKQPRKKFIKISCRNSLKFTVACRCCIHQPAPDAPRLRPQGT